MKKQKSIITTALENGNVANNTMNKESNKQNKEHVTITFKHGKATIRTKGKQDSDCITIVLETGQTVTITPKQAVILENDEFHKYELLGWQIQKGDDCLFLLGSGCEVEKFLSIDLVKNIATVEDAFDKYNTYYVKDGRLYRDCDVNIYLSPFERGIVNVGTLPLGWIYHTQKSWFRHLFG